MLRLGNRSFYSSDDSFYHGVSRSDAQRSVDDSLAHVVNSATAQSAPVSNSRVVTRHRGTRKIHHSDIGTLELGSVRALYRLG